MTTKKAQPVADNGDLIDDLVADIIGQAQGHVSLAQDAIEKLTQDQRLLDRYGDFNLGLTFGSTTGRAAIHKALKAKGLSVRQIAAQTGVNRETVRRDVADPSGSPTKRKADTSVSPDEREADTSVSPDETEEETPAAMAPLAAAAPAAPAAPAIVIVDHYDKVFAAMNAIYAADPAHLLAHINAQEPGVRTAVRDLMTTTASTLTKYSKEIVS